jgi:hypothetical protein
VRRNFTLAGIGLPGFIHRGEPQLTVEQDDVIVVDLSARGEQLHREQVPG